MGVQDSDLAAVANAYMQVRSAQGDEEPAFQFALAVFRGRHPDMSPEEANVRVGRLVSEAVETFGLWRQREEMELLDS